MPMEAPAAEFRLVGQAPSEAAFAAIDALSQRTRLTKEDVDHFERVISDMPGAVFGDSELLPLKHSFADGVYIREIFHPKGVVLVGAIQKHKIVSFLMEGSLLIGSVEFGMKKIQAPCHWVSSPGMKRIVFALEDSVFVTIHRTDETDVAKIRGQLMVDTWDEFTAYASEKAISDGGVK